MIHEETKVLSVLNVGLTRDRKVKKEYIINIHGRALALIAQGCRTMMNSFKVIAFTL